MVNSREYQISASTLVWFGYITQKALPYVEPLNIQICQGVWALHMSKNEQWREENDVKNLFYCGRLIITNVLL